MYLNNFKWEFQGLRVIWKNFQRSAFCIQADMPDTHIIKTFARNLKIDSAIHLAGLSAVGEFTTSLFILR